jgi:hypothetical protein
MAVAGRPPVTRTDVRSELGPLVGSAVLLAVTPSDALAYVDPGSGALLWQAALSAFFGGLFLARRALLRVLRGIGRGRREKIEPADAPISVNGSADGPGPNG